MSEVFLVLGNLTTLRPHGYYEFMIFGNFGVDPYQVMRLGVIPGINASGNNVRRGTQNVGQLVRGQLPYSFPTQDVPANMPAPAMAGSWGNPFGTFGGIDPYMAMRLGTIPNIHASGNNIRSGVTGAGALVRSQFPFSFPNAG